MFNRSVVAMTLLFSFAASAMPTNAFRGATVRAVNIVSVINDRNQVVEQTLYGDEYVVLSQQGDSIKLRAGGMEPGWANIYNSNGEANFVITKDSQTTLLELTGTIFELENKLYGKKRVRGGK